MIVFLGSILLYSTIASCDANFEDTRCRCICTNTKFFNENQTAAKDNQRRFYTMTNISPSLCTAQSVVKKEVTNWVDESKMDAFLANCDCKFQSRNTVMLKVVVAFVICVIALLVSYMAFLMCLDPMLKRKRFQMPYRQQNDEMEDNIFARAASGSVSEASIATSEEASTMRARNSNVLGRVEAEQSRWMKKVEEQRRNIFEDHTMLN